ncbi:hypothetical protein V1478_000343 [Vespula squamosa]|uniref:Uncharacterized protein n=1 Tax=Vespula squamosa TaxID=30214 RepID=A0ABD2C582_VESSQ
MTRNFLKSKRTPDGEIERTSLASNGVSPRIRPLDSTKTSRLRTKQTNKSIKLCVRAVKLSLNRDGLKHTRPEYRQVRLITYESCHLIEKTRFNVKLSRYLSHVTCPYGSLIKPSTKASNLTTINPLYRTPLGIVSRYRFRPRGLCDPRGPTSRSSKVPTTVTEKERAGLRSMPPLD